LLASLSYSAGQRTATRPDTGFNNSLESLSPWEHPIKDDYTREELEEEVRKAVLCLKLDATPGFPYGERYQTNAAVLESVPEQLISDAVDRLQLLLETQEIKDDPQWFVENGFHDLVTPFEKQEPHPTRKACVGKWRIVSCLSVDQLVERVLYSRCVDAVKHRYPKSEAVIGIGFTDEMSTEFAENVLLDTDHSRLYSTDISGWDRSQSRPYILNACEMCIKQCTSPSLKKIKRAMRHHAMMITNPLWMVPDPSRTCRLLLSRKFPGGMLSGSYLTTLFNTLSRLDVAYLCGAEKAFAAGDDAIEQHQCIETARSKYAELGFTLRDVEKLNSNSIQFCSHTYTKTPVNTWVASLDTWPKALYRFLTNPTNCPERYEQRRYALVYETRHNSNSRKIEDIASLHMDSLNLYGDVEPEAS
jgi:hypothetical protein